MPLHESWHIRSRARQCAVTEKPFNEGDTIITALFPDPESSGYLRKDFSAEAWNELGDEADAAFSFWRSTYVPPVQQEKVDPMKKEDPETLLRRLVDEDEEHTENVRYILAVMLERQKLLRETDSQPIPSGVLRVYEHRKTGDAFLIRDPNIPLDEVEKVQEEVVMLLESGGRLPDPEEENAEGESTGESEEEPANDTGESSDEESGEEETSEEVEDSESSDDDTDSEDEADESEDDEKEEPSDEEDQKS